MSTTTTKTKPVKVPAPSLRRSSGTHWGDDFRAAFLQAKRHFGAGVITNKAVAARVSQLVPTTDTTILRLGYLPDPPRGAAQRQTAWLALVAMGFEPGEFGLTSSDRALRGYTDIELRKMLDPGWAHQ